MRCKYSARLIICVSVVAAALALPALSKKAEAWGRPKYNVLFIDVDTLRSDRLGCYGYKNIATPNIDGIAKKGTLFKNVISQAPLTFPSHCTVFTSTYPQYHRARDNGGFRLKKSAVTLAELLEKLGYNTAAFVSSIVLDSRYGLNKGFRTYDERMDRTDAKRVIRFMDEERRADRVTEAAANWLSANAKNDKPFFLWVHYYDPHSPYDPPSPYKERYKNAPYDGEVAFVDENIGVLLKKLSALGLAKNTLIVFFSDHGESLGEHGEDGHAIFVYDEVMKVPLIFSMPGVIPEGRVIDDQVRLADIMPTVLDVLGSAKNKEIQGISLFGRIRGGAKLKLDAYSESYYAKYHFNWSELLSLRTDEWKYIRTSEPELYNIKNDPGELTNLAAEKPEIIAEIDNRLEKFLKKTTSPDEKEDRIEADKATKEKLESLGYVQGTLGEGKEPVPFKMVKVIGKLSLGDRYANQGDIDKAIEIYNEILKEDPSNSEAYSHIGHCYKELKRYDDAIAAFKKAASFKPDDAEIHNGLGNVYKTMGRPEDAFREFKKALELEPENVDYMNNVGWYYQQMLDVDKAMAEYEKVLKKDPDIATTHANMAILYRIKGNLDKAIEEARKAIELEPKLAFAHSELGACLATKGDLDQAIEHCKKGIEYAPYEIDGYNNLGVCYEMKGDYKMALENFQKALDIAPWDPLIHCNIGNSYLNLGDRQKAEEWYKKALDIDPGCRKALFMLDKISKR